MTENQKLREVATELDRLMLVIESAVRHDDPRNHAAVMALIRANKEALALPTADHIPDAGKMIETAAPVGELERFEAYFAWSRKNKGANRRPNFERFEEDGTYKDDHTQRHWWTWQQALSAGDAVDAERYRWL